MTLPAAEHPYGEPSEEPLAVPAQWDAGRPDFPSRALLRAVLGVALRDLRAAGKQRKAAATWFASEDESAFSFRWICACLELDAQALRDRLGRSAAESAAPQRTHT
jgi:hypothetical protein